MSAELDAVVFDLGMVLSSPAALFCEIASAVGVDAEAVERHYQEGRHAWDSGGPAASYWGPMFRRLGVEPTAEAIAAAAAADVTQWAGIRPEAWQLLRDCRAAGHRVAVLSNAPREMEDAITASPWHRDIDDLFVSGVLGMVKPDPDIYAHVAQRLGTRLAFIDDRAPNVEAAARAGWRAHLWVDDADTRAWLKSLSILA